MEESRVYVTSRSSLADIISISRLQDKTNFFATTIWKRRQQGKKDGNVLRIAPLLKEYEEVILQIVYT